MLLLAQAPPNTLVNNPNEDHTPADTQSETTLVLGAPPNVVVAFNDSGSLVTGSHFTGLALSTNRGQTFTDLGTAPQAGTLGDAGDPVLARDNAAGVIYLSTISLMPGCSSLAVPVFRSLNNGASFTQSVDGAPGFAACDQLDRDFITVDNFPGTGQGNVYLSFTNFSGFGPGSRLSGIYLTRSTNQGVTWIPNGATPVMLRAGVQGSAIAVGKSHEVFVFWHQDAGTGPASIQLKKSLNRGVTFGPPVTVANLNSPNQNGDLPLNGDFRSDSFPHVVVNPATGALYVVYNDLTHGGDAGDIFFTQSLNGGQTWSAPRRVNDDATLRDQWTPTLAVTPDGTHLFIGFYDRRLSPTNSLIDYFGVIGRIAGAVVTFTPNFRITSQAFPSVVAQDGDVKPNYMGDYDTAVADNNSFFVAWGDNRDPDQFNANQPDIRFATIPVAFNPPPPPLPPPTLPVVPPTNAVMRCSLGCPNLLGCYSVGAITIDDQFCSFNGPTVPSTLNPLTLPPNAEDTGLTAGPGGAKIFRCTMACPNLAACDSIGALTTNFQFCSITGPSLPPTSVSQSVAMPTGLTTKSGLPIFRCVQSCPYLGACVGAGRLVTHPQFCSIGGPVPQPGHVAPSIALDTGLRVP